MGFILKQLGFAPLKNYNNDLGGKNVFTDEIQDAAVNVAIIADDCETVKWPILKNMVSDDTMQLNIKGELSENITTRAVPILTANSLPVDGISGISNKVIILRAKQTFDDNIPKEEYDEILSVILGMTNNDFTMDTIIPDLKKTSDEFLRAHLYMFMRGWETTEDMTKAFDAYKAYLMYANPYADMFTIENETRECLKSTSRPPTNLACLSYRNFASQMKINGNESHHGHNGNFFYGKPPVIEEETINDDDHESEAKSLTGQTKVYTRQDNQTGLLNAVNNPNSELRLIKILRNLQKAMNTGTRKEK